MRAAGHVGVQMGAQDKPPSGGMEVFFRVGRAGGHPAGQEWLSSADKTEKGNKTGLSFVQNVESKEEKAKEQRKAQCAVCGKWWQPSTTARWRCPTCGGPSESWMASAPPRHLVEDRPGHITRTMDPIVKSMLDRARPVTEFMDEEKEVWGVHHQRGQREGGK